MKKLAETLRGRAAAGEDFAKLQDESIAASGFKGKPPTRLGKVRRTSLPPEQGEVFNLKVGETSQLISTPNGYLVYKVGDKDTLPMDHVREEITHHAAVATHAGFDASHSAVGNAGVEPEVFCGCGGRPAWTSYGYPAASDEGP